jgi:hypothetical protein
MSAGQRPPVAMQRNKIRASESADALIFIDAPYRAPPISQAAEWDESIVLFGYLWERLSCLNCKDVPQKTKSACFRGRFLFGYN